MGEAETRGERSSENGAPEPGRRLTWPVVLVVGLLAAVALHAALRDPPPPSALALYRQGLAAMDEGRPAEAAGLFERALEQDPEHIPSLQAMGWALQVQGRAVEAPYYYRRTREQAARFGALAAYNLGVFHTQEGRPKEARREYRIALALDPAYVPAMYNLGVVEMESGNLDLAAELFREVLMIDRGHAESRANLEWIKNRPPAPASAPTPTAVPAP